MDVLDRRVADAVEERLGDEVTAPLQDIHAHPELTFQETSGQPVPGWLAQVLGLSAGRRS